MADERDFRIEHSELRDEDEFTEYSSTDLPYYSDWRGSFEKLPWATDDEALRAANADVAIVGAPLDDAVSSRPGRTVRAEGDPDGADRVVDRLRLVDPVGCRALRTC